MMQLLLAMSFASFPVGAQLEQELASVERLWVASPVEGQVVDFKESLKAGSMVTKGQKLILVVDRERKEIWVRSPVSGILLNLYFREALTNRFIRTGEPLLCIGYVKQK